MNTREEVLTILTAARIERGAERSYRLFEAALRLCEEWKQTVGGTDPLIQHALILSEIAYEESSPKNRAQRWGRALSILESSLRGCIEPEVAETYASLAVDCHQDIFSSLTSADRLKSLRTARNFIDAALKQQHLNDIKATLLARKSSLWRQLAMYEISSEQKVNFLNKSMRCADLAVQTSRQIATILESALSLWAWARYEATDEKYSEILKDAERRFTDDLLRKNEVARLALSRFYKSTYRHLDVCENYLDLTKLAKQTRRLLREAYIYAEAVIQLRYADYPEDVVRKHLLEARGLVEMAIAAGYRNARLITALAHIVAIMDGTAAGATALSEIHAEGGTVPWERIVKLVTEADMTDPAAYGLVLGIDQSAVWTSIGTFARRYIRDDSLAQVFYQTAIKLDNRNPVALTNLARLLVLQEDERLIGEAERLLQKAAGCSDRRFTWWRAVMALLNDRKAQLRSKPKLEARTHKSIPDEPSRFSTLKQIRDRFKAVDQLDDPQRRGYELEILIFELARLTFDIAAPPYKLNRLGGGQPQVDGFFVCRNDKYRIECKWENHPANPNDIAIFKNKLDAAGVDGLFIAMNGFTDAAVGQAREFRTEKAILLMNGDEARYALTLQISFDELMTQKRLYFDQMSEPYRIVRPIYEAA